MRSLASSLSRRAIVGLVALLTCAAFVSACSSSKKSGGGAGASSSTTGSSVHVKNYSFDPQTVTVAVGTKVTWTFDDPAAHTVTASDGSFKSGDLSSGGTYSHTFNTAGTYSYICSIHQYMHGSVTVK